MTSNAMVSSRPSTAVFVFWPSGTNFYLQFPPPGQEGAFCRRRIPTPSSFDGIGGRRKKSVLRNNEQVNTALRRVEEVPSAWGWRKGQPFLPPTVLYIARVLKHAVDPRIVLKQILVFPTRQVASLWLRSLPDWCPNALGIHLCWLGRCTAL
jgi:hypothetical protein